MMKKNLLATSALVAAGALVSQGALAEAKPIEIKVGGYYEQWVGFVSQDADNASDSDRVNATGVDVQEDGEIFFKGSTTLDNGLTFGVNVQLEAASSGDQIDESYLFARGSFGEVVLGSENGPAYAMHYGIDIDQGYGLEEGDTAFYWFSGGAINQLNTTRLATLDNDSQKIRWISPRFEGFQIGLSFAPEGSQDSDGRIPNETDNKGKAYKGGTPVTADGDPVLGASGKQLIDGKAAGSRGTAENIFAAAINYDNTFGDVRVRLSAGGQYVGDMNDLDPGTDDSVWGTSVGLRIGYGGFEGAIAWGHHDLGGTNILGFSKLGGAAIGIDSTAVGEPDYLPPGAAGVDSIDVIGAGIAYTSGPVGVSLTGAYGMVDMTYGNDLDADPTQLTVLLGAKYKLGPGVEARATAAFVQSEDVVSIKGNALGGDYTGFGVVGGIRLVF